MLFELYLYHYYLQSYRHFYDIKSVLFCPFEFRFFL